MENILLRQKALERFNQLRFRAGIWRWWHRLRRQPQTLLPLAPIRDCLPHTQPTLKTTQMVPVCQIIGSVQRAHDYDRQFRPLKNSLRERWVDINVLNETVGWAPVELVQVGNIYFIMDGHHRVSVARHSGLAQVEAVVIAYPFPVQFDTGDSLAAVLAQLRLQNRADDEQPHSKRMTNRTHHLLSTVLTWH